MPIAPLLAKLPNLLLFGGGVVIEFHDEVIGAIGAAGAPGGDLDENCAGVGLEKKLAAAWNRGPPLRLRLKRTRQASSGAVRRLPWLPARSAHGLTGSSAPMLGLTEKDIWALG